MKPEDITEMVTKMRASYNLPAIGSAENPYVLYVPGWAEDQAVAEGTTCQEVADKTFRYHVRVEVIR